MEGQAITIIFALFFALEYKLYTKSCYGYGNYIFAAISCIASVLLREAFDVIL